MMSEAELIEWLAQQSNSNKEVSLQDSISENATKLKDAFSNSVLGIGQADHLAQFNDYTFDNSTLNWFLWTALYNESWVFRRTIDKPSQDMIRPGISLTGGNDYTKVYKQLDLMKPDLIDALKWSKLYGGSILVLLFKGIKFDDMANPIDYKKIAGSKYIRCYVTDRWFGCSPSYDDIVSNIANDDFGKPKYYDVQFADGSHHRIHHSWILRFENRGAPQLIKTGQLQGWGYAEGAHILHELSRDEKLKTSIQSLVDKSLIEVIKMSGMRGVFMGADKGNEEQLKKRLEMVNWGRNFNSLTFLDKDDDYQQHNFSGLSGLSDLLDLNMRQIAAAVEMPNVLYGDLSNGFTSDDQALERYDEKILNDDETYLRKPLSKLVKILYRVYNVKNSEGKYPEVGIIFNSIIASKKNEQKLNEFNSIYEICSNLVKDNLMTAEQEANTLQEYLDTGSVNLQLLPSQSQLSKEIKKSAEEAKENEEGSNLDINPETSGNLDGDTDNDMGDINLGSNELRRNPSKNEAPAPEENSTSPESQRSPEK